MTAKTVPVIYLEHIDSKDQDVIYNFMDNLFGRGKWLVGDLPSKTFFGRMGKDDNELLLFMSKPENLGKVISLEELNQTLYAGRPKTKQAVAMYVSRMRNALQKVGSSATITCIKGKGYVYKE